MANYKRAVPAEHAEQVALVRWWRTLGCRLRRDVQGEQMSPGQLWSIPNGGTNSKITGHNLNLEGRQAGVADLCLQAMCRRPDPPGVYGALFLELKRQQGGRQSTAQKDFEALCWRCGYAYVLCRGCGEAILRITEYVSGALAAPPDCGHPTLEGAPNDD